MKQSLSLFLLTILLVACTPIVTSTSSATEQVFEPITPVVTEGSGFYNGCTHMVSYPPEFTTDGAGLLFETQDTHISFYINIRRRTESERGLSLEELMSNIGMTYGNPSNSQELNPVILTDFLGQELEGVITEFTTTQGMQTRVMIFVRPETLLMDMVKDDVVYELVAQAPTGDWAEWEPRFEIFFDNFHPIECGGV